MTINPNSSPLVSYLYGEIKRGTDGNYYIPNMGEASDQIHAYNGSGYDNYTYTADTLYKLASGLPTQVYKVFDNSKTIKEFVRTVGNKDYELKDHLGNVRVVISDAKQIVSVGTNSAIVDANDSFEPEVRNYTDYYAFGSLMPGRQYNSGDYRYGFNGKENDNEVKGTGNQQDYGDRVYNSRLGKFLSIDPLTKSYPMLTPYQFASNRPIDGIDLDGREFVHFTVTDINDGKVTGIKKVDETHSTWGHAAFHRIFGINFEAFKVYTLNYKGKNYMFNNFRDMFTDVKKLDPEKVPTYEGLTTLFNITDAAGGIMAGTMSNAIRARTNSVKTPYGDAVQSSSADATQALEAITEETTLYRLGTTNKSKTGPDAQFWSTENPLADPQAYSEKFNIPVKNIQNADFIETANIKKGSNFVTREAASAPGSNNTGNGIEVVTEQGGTQNNVITPIKKDPK